MTQSVEKPEPVFPIERWGTLTKALRVVAWVLRFIHNVRKHGKCSDQKRKGDLSIAEMQSAQKCLIKNIQSCEFHTEMKAMEKGVLLPKTSSLTKLSPFLAEDGLLRVQGRLQFSSLSYSEKHPIIIPKGHSLSYW